MSSKANIHKRAFISLASKKIMGLLLQLEGCGWKRKDRSFKMETCFRWGSSCHKNKAAHVSSSNSKPLNSLFQGPSFSHQRGTLITVLQQNHGNTEHSLRQLGPAGGDYVLLRKGGRDKTQDTSVSPTYRQPHMRLGRGIF